MTESSENIENNENLNASEYEQKKVIKDLASKVNSLVSQIRNLSVNCENLLQENENWRIKYNKLKNSYLEHIEKGTFLDSKTANISDNTIKKIEEKISNLEKEQKNFKLKIKANNKEIEEFHKRKSDSKNNPVEKVELIYNKELSRLQEELNSITEINEKENEKFNSYNEKIENLLQRKKELEMELMEKVDENKEENNGEKIFERKDNSKKNTTLLKKNTKNSKINKKK